MWKCSLSLLLPNQQRTTVWLSVCTWSGTAWAGNVERQKGLWSLCRKRPEDLQSLGWGHLGRAWHYNPKSFGSWHNTQVPQRSDLHLSYVNPQAFTIPEMLPIKVFIPGGFSTQHWSYPSRPQRLALSRSSYAHIQSWSCKCSEGLFFLVCLFVLYVGLFLLELYLTGH